MTCDSEINLYTFISHKPTLYRDTKYKIYYLQYLHNICAGW